MHPTHFFKYCTAKVAKLMLGNCRIRWNSPANFNDPFDCYFSLESKFHILAEKERFVARFRELWDSPTCPKFDNSNPMGLWWTILLPHRNQLKTTDIASDIQTFVEDLHNHTAASLPVIRADWEREIADLRLLCVCEEKYNILLWSHYTENHTGAAFQFECIPDLDVPLLEARKVVYSDEAPSMASREEFIDRALGLIPLGDPLEIYRSLVGTKAKAWEHEKEWRVVDKRRPYERAGYEDCLFHPQEISTVFLGCRISAADRSEILSLLKGPFAHVKAFQAERNANSFKLDFVPLN